MNTVNKKALVIAKKVLDRVSYNTENANVTWEACSLRAWLNSTFYNAAFDSTEQDRILLSHIENPDNPYYGTVGGNATDDKVFLLSIQEATSYFEDRAARKADATQYVIGAGGSAVWWLRSPGDSSDHAIYVGSDGTTYFRGIGVIYPEGVRPVMWITYN